MIFMYLVEKSIYQRESEITKNYKIKRTLPLHRESRGIKN